jgi:hypothetical protein
VEHWWVVDADMSTNTDMPNPGKHKISGYGVIAVWYRYRRTRRQRTTILFPREHGVSVKGLALGIAGD